MFALGLSTHSSAYADHDCARSLIESHAARSPNGLPIAIDGIQSPEIQEKLHHLLNARIILVLADHDGTFKAHEANSEAVWPTETDRELLRTFEAHPQLEFYFITGRPIDWVYARYAEHRGIGFSANHGVVEKPIYSHDWLPLYGLAEDWREAIELLEDFKQRIPLARIEHKLGYVFHWKESENRGSESLAQADELARDLYQKLLEKFSGRPVRFAWSDNGRYFEILPDDSRMGKGEAALRILRRYLGEKLEEPLDIFVITAGDENPDNEMHSVIRELERQGRVKGMSIKVGEHLLTQSTAEFWMKSPQDFQAFLEAMLDQLKR